MKEKIKQLMDLKDRNKINWEQFKEEVNLILDSTNETPVQSNNFNSNNNINVNQVSQINQRPIIQSQTIDLSNQKPIVEIKNLTKHYKGREKSAINNISFNIYEGRFHAFIGANGAGKTTTIKSIIGAYSKYKFSGQILINGKPNDHLEVKKIIGYIPEDAKFPKKMILKDYLYVMTRLSGLSSSESKKKVNTILRDLKLESLKNKKPYNFSSGQKKRVLLAQSLIHDPKILIMDEPAANLDPIARHDLFDSLVNLQKQGKAIFISSHILDEIGKYANQCTILDGGEVVFDGAIRSSDDLVNLYKQYVKKGSVDTGIVTSTNY